jgi:hypothetical protein
MVEEKARTIRCIIHTPGYSKKSLAFEDAMINAAGRSGRSQWHLVIGRKSGRRQHALPNCGIMFIQ